MRRHPPGALEHWIESAVVLSEGGSIDDDLLPTSSRRAGREVPDPGGVPPGLPLDEAMRRYALRALEAAGGNKTEAARRLGIGRNRLARLLASGDEDPG